MTEDTLAAARRLLLWLLSVTPAGGAPGASAPLRRAWPLALRLLSSTARHGSGAASNLAHLLSLGHISQLTEVDPPTPPLPPTRKDKTIMSDDTLTRQLSLL